MPSFVVSVEAAPVISADHLIKLYTATMLLNQPIKSAQDVSGYVKPESLSSECNDYGGSNN